MIASIWEEFCRLLRFDDLLATDLDVERVVPSRHGDIVIGADGIHLEADGKRRCLYRATPGNGEW